MNKKCAFLCAVIIICSCLLGCTSENTSSYEVIEVDGGRIIYTSESGKQYTIDTLPFDMTYNDKTIKLSDVKYYETEQDYEYYGYMVVTLDISALDERDKHWLYEEERIKVSGLYTDGNNHFDYEHLQELKPVEHDNKLYYVIKSPTYKNGYKESLVGTDASVHIDITQDETYERPSTEDANKLLTFNKRDVYIYSKVLEGNDLGTLEDMVFYLGDVLDLSDIENQ